MPEAAQTTLRALFAAGDLAPRVLAATPCADCWAADGAIFAVVEATAMRLPVALVVLLMAPPGAVWTTMSPPRTGSPP